LSHRQITDQTTAITIPTQDCVYLHVAINVPLRRFFEYKIPLPQPFELLPGMRVEVPFSGKNRIGIIAKVSTHSEYPAKKIKSIIQLLDDAPLINQSMVKLADWMVNYYHAPAGEVWQTLLPTSLMKGEPCKAKRVSCWQITPLGSTSLAENKIANNAIKQKQAMQCLQQNLQDIAHDNLSNYGLNLATLKSLAGKQWVSRNYQTEEKSLPLKVNTPEHLQLNQAQSQAINSVCKKLSEFHCWLLFGVTASGKTEVYLRIIEQVIQQGKQALILVPEIGLTPQTVSRFQQRFNTQVETLHSGITEQQRLQSWLKARSGHAKIIIGTRSALFVPLKNPGIIIIDEEHDHSFKQQQGLRYSARDIAMVRGSIENIPVLLGSASPSIETLMNVEKKKITQLSLPQKAMTTQTLNYRIIDLKKQPIKQGLSFALIESIAHHLKKQGQILLFLNRRGYSPVLLCHQCGWSSACDRCDSHFTYHHHHQHLQCHHCGSNRRIPKQCPQCSCDEMIPVGLGTERLEETIRQLFPDANVCRIDRDTTRKKSAMNDFVSDIKSGKYNILIGTQMLAKGHHFPNVSLVGLVDMDGALYSSDFRAPEYAAQLITQVSGRAGRAEKSGEVFIQTHHADHPMLQQLIHHGYETFAASTIKERIEAHLPPHTYQAVFQAEATYQGHAKTFLQDVKQILKSVNLPSVELLGPVPAVYTKKAGKFRYQLYIESINRVTLHQLLNQSLTDVEKLKSASRVRWRMEVDPIAD